MSDTSIISFTLNDQPCQAKPGETVLQAAKRAGVDIPALCFKEGYRPDGNCRACVVEIAGERTLAPSCCRFPAADMVVSSVSAKARKSQTMVLEMLLADLPEAGYKWNDALPTNPSGQHGELSWWADQLGVTVRAPLQSLVREQPAPDLSHPAIAVNLASCIQCNRCVRACREEQANDVIGYAGSGSASYITFDLNAALGQSTCVGCGECVQACPTGALMPKTQVGSQLVDRKVDSICPYCGVGCAITYQVRDEKIISVVGRNGPANQSRLCIKGRFGFDYVHHDQRLTKPLVRRTGVAKNPSKVALYQHWSEVFREATWDEALALAGGRLAQLRDDYGKKTLAGFGSAKGTNEEAYLFQKLVRLGFGNNNVDHCTRLCHASSVAALLEGVGSGAVSNPVADVEHSDVIFIIGSNPTANHPVAATWMKNAATRGAKIILLDPRRTDIAKYAWRSLQFKADTDVLVLNALIHVVIAEGLFDQSFLQSRASNFEALKQQVLEYSPEAVQERCGINPATLREVARQFASAKAAMILWGMGISQHIHGTDNARCLIALATITGQIGRPGTGLHPLRGQNNV